MMTWTDEQVDQWCLSLRAYREDIATKADAVELRALRHRARQQMLLALSCFLESQGTLQDFNTIFQQQTHYDWNIFGIRGMSGGMFLNKLIKYIPQDERLEQQIRVALPLPENTRDGLYRMRALTLFLERLIAIGKVSRSQIQPARLPFFLSAWWHIQDEEQWPRFAGRLRLRIFRGLPLADPPIDQVELYFAFRQRFLALKEAFGISAWELEHFLLWQMPKQEQKVHLEQKQEKRIMIESGKGGRASLPNGQTRRLYLQWLLAKIGKQVGYDVWIARQDHEKIWDGEPFQELSISSLPFAERDVQLEEVAILWLRKNEVVAAYEIDPKSTAIVQSLLRLYDFGIACAKRPLHLCLVLPRPHFEQACAELSRPLFRQYQERLHWALMGIEDLASQAEHILRWATSPTVIENLLVFPEQMQEQTRGENTTSLRLSKQA